MPDPVAGLIRTMSPREKIGQLIMAGFDTPAEAVRLIRDLRLGGVILFKRNIATEEQTAQDIATLQQAVASGLPPLFVAVDQEGGRVSRLPASSGPFPSARSIGDRQDPQLAYQAGLDTGRILLRLGFNMNLAPVLDIASNPQNTVIGTRAFGTTAEAVIAAGLPFMNGLEASGILAAVKHFPGHGDTRIDSHVALPVVDKSMAQLHLLELRPFAEAIAQNAALIMVAHLVLSELDNRPASLSPLVVDGLLRDEMGYAGVVITDDLIMGAISQYVTIGEAAVLAVLAGCDIILVGAGSANLQAVHAALLDALHNGRLSQERLDLSLARILLLKRRLGASG
jgi:beta-N-acetylhexosaminidase